MKLEDRILLTGGLVLLTWAIAMIIGTVCIEDFTAYSPRMLVAASWLCVGFILVAISELTR